MTIHVKPRKILRASLSEQVVQALLRAIISRESTNDQRLPSEHELAEQFQVSRSVIREAVRVLVSKGLVQVRQGKGMQAAPASSWDPLDPAIMRVLSERGKSDRTWRHLAEVRRIIEVETAGLAATRRSAEDLAAMNEAFQHMRSSVSDSEDYRKADVQFHLTIVRAAHNPVLQRILEPLHDLLLAGGLRVPHSAGSIERSLEEHKQVYMAIESANGKEARTAMALLFPQAVESDAQSIKSKI